ncbi:MAG: hypothetical protein AB1631_29095 [Acidobacteriota bacterium]
MEITVDVPDELARRLGNLKDDLPQILESGLRELNASAQGEYNGAAEVLEFLARLPSPEEIIALRPSKALQNRVNELVEKNRDEGLTADEERFWEKYQYLEHLVRLAKAQAFLKLKNHG